MPRRTPLSLAALASVLVGCGDDGVIAGTGATSAAPPRAVQVELALDAAPPGPPDAGTQGGHRAPDGVLEVDSGRASFTAAVTPLDAELRATADEGRRVRVDGAPGRARVEVTGLRRGANRVELVATAAGLAPWRGDVTITRR